MSPEPQNPASLPHPEPSTIVEWPRIKVRTWQLADVPSSARHLNNKAIWDRLRDRIPHPYLESDAVAWITECNNPEMSVRSGPWTPQHGSTGPLRSTNYAIIVDGEAVGGIGVDFGKDVYFRSAEIGYWLGEELWGRGIMSRVVPGFVEWVWRTFGILVRINACTFEWNEASGKVLRKAGFEYEGRQRDAIVKNGVIGTQTMWGALRPK